jgi:hypothetical protein
VHDGVFFEDNGIPVATVISAEFVRAARAQADALGAADYRTVVVAHPIQPLTREEGEGAGRSGIRRNRPADHRMKACD